MNSHHALPSVVSTCYFSCSLRPSLQISLPHFPFLVLRLMTGPATAPYMSCEALLVAQNGQKRLLASGLNVGPRRAWGTGREGGREEAEGHFNNALKGFTGW